MQCAPTVPARLASSPSLTRAIIVERGILSYEGNVYLFRLIYAVECRVVQLYRDGEIQAADVSIVAGGMGGNREDPSVIHMEGTKCM